MASCEGSTEYQQLMLNFLTDRDYDNFDFNEFEFLKEKIGYALFGPPQNEEGYDEKQDKKIKFLFDIIVNESNLISKWQDRVVMSVVYNCTEPFPEEKLKRSEKYPDYNPKYDLCPVPVFILRKCKKSEFPCRVIIDDTGRVYTSWDQYLTNNKLPECLMVVPVDGRYQEDSFGQVKLERRTSPSCNLDSKILQGVDIASALGGIASGGVFVAAAIPAVAVAPAALVAAAVTGVGVGAYSIGRSIYTLYDKGKHKESLSFADSGARGAYLNIVAGSLGFVGAGASMAVSQLAARGINISNGARAAFDAVNVVNLSASGISVANSSYDVWDQWKNENQAPSALTILQLSSSILFFGHAIYNFKGATTVIKETQANNLKEIQDSLSSNKQRRMFNKLVKETIRQNSGNVEKGQAQVIQSIRSMDNKDQVLQTLSRWNKVLNKNKVRFAVEDGKVTLNGKAVNIGEFGNMDKNQVITYLSKLPDIPNPTHSNVKTITFLLQKAFNQAELLDVVKLAMGVAQIFGNSDLTIKEKIINSVAGIMNSLRLDPFNYIETLDKMFPYTKYFELINMVSHYFQKLVNKVEEKYQKWLKTKDPSFEEPYFAKLSLEFAKRAIEIFNKVTEIYFIGTNLTEQGLKLLLNYFWDWFAKQYYEYNKDLERKKERIEHNKNLRAPKVTCPDCGGYFYDRTKF